ncbi:MAG: cyclin-dependent kinase inhibitor 3 family protein [Acetobacteraceae bacterium]|nr:cyclin-dependent kinase inhibitor 3 family protein [Acetobacteraceae bacterium]
MTSITHPLRINAVEAVGGGLIGMTLCPGKKQKSGMNGEWDRDLDLDLEVIRAWGAVAVVTLMEEHELATYKVQRLGEKVQALGMEWYHLPIRDADVPGAGFEALWARSGPVLRQHLKHGSRILLHCRGGLGRTGMIAARLLAELGVPPREAVAAVRKARQGAIETSAQDRHVSKITPVM